MAWAWNTSGETVSATMVADQARNWSRSATGMPSSSQITVIGSGNANEANRSTSRRVDISSSRAAVMAVIRGRSSSTRRAVKALLTSLRSRS